MQAKLGVYLHIACGRAGIIVDSCFGNHVIAPAPPRKFQSLPGHHHRAVMIDPTFVTMIFIFDISCPSLPFRIANSFLLFLIPTIIFLSKSLHDALPACAVTPIRMHCPDHTMLSSHWSYRWYQHCVGSTTISRGVQRLCDIGACL